MLAGLKSRFERYPTLATWLVLSVGFLIALFWSARTVPLGLRQFLVLGAAAVAVAGACAWIIGLEAEDDVPCEEEEHVAITREG
jgi:hypothetical protein